MTDTSVPETPVPTSRTAVTLLRHGYATPRRDQPLLSAGVASLESIAARIRSGPETIRLTEAFRATLSQLGDKSTTVKAMKSRLPAIIPAMALPAGTPIRNLPELLPHTGLYVFDIDQDITPDMLPGAMTALVEYDHTLLAATSTSGEALYVIFAGPVATDPLHHKLLWNAIHLALPQHLRQHAAPSQNNITRTRIIAHDPNCHLAPRAEPILVEADAAPARTHSRHIVRTTDVSGRRTAPDLRATRVQSISEGAKHTQLVRSALAALPQHYADVHATWIATAFRLAGGQHIHGGAFRGRELFSEWSRTSARYEPGDESAFDKAYIEWDGRATTGGIIADAKRAGWRPPPHLLS